MKNLSIPSLVSAAALSLAPMSTASAQENTDKWSAGLALHTQMYSPDKRAIIDDSPVVTGFVQKKFDNGTYLIARHRRSDDVEQTHLCGGKRGKSEDFKYDISYCYKDVGEFADGKALHDFTASVKKGIWKASGSIDVFDFTGPTDRFTATAGFTLPITEKTKLDIEAYASAPLDNLDFDIFGTHSQVKHVLRENFSAGVGVIWNDGEKPMPGVSSSLAF